MCPHCCHRHLQFGLLKLSFQIPTKSAPYPMSSTFTDGGFISLGPQTKNLGAFLDFSLPSHTQSPSNRLSSPAPPTSLTSDPHHLSPEWLMMRLFQIARKSYACSEMTLETSYQVRSEETWETSTVILHHLCPGGLTAGRHSWPYEEPQNDPIL